MKLLSISWHNKNAACLWSYLKFRQTPKCCPFILIATETRNNNHSLVIKGGIDCFKPSRKLRPQETVLEIRHLQKNLSGEQVQPMQFNRLVTPEVPEHTIFWLLPSFSTGIIFFHLYQKRKSVPKEEHNALLQFLGCCICRDLSCSFIPQSY